LNVTERRLPAPTELRAYFASLDGDVVISWSYRSDANAIAGFDVERALDPDGPWTLPHFTRATSMADVLSDGLSHCYRVTAVAVLGSDLKSAPSAPLCIARPRL
jgi:hypothetical protein